jgi:PepSY-associated TM region
VRLLFLTHRYLGIGVSLLMVTWCLSGVVMMYVSYPQLSQSQRLAALPRLDLSACCQEGDAASILPDARINDVRVEMVGPRAIAQLSLPDRREVIDLKSGKQAHFAVDQAATVAGRLAALAKAPAAFEATELIQDDQWTVSGDFGRDRPLYRFSLVDPAHTDLYVSSTTGRAVQMTTRNERFWNWFGAVPHWVYFTALRRHPAMWNWFIVITSTLGCFLTVLGIVIGTQQLRLRPSNRFTPYRGFMMWHHIPGVIFGGFALAWVLSGLLSMNPWGLLESDGPNSEFERIRGTSPTWREVQSALRNLAVAAPLQGMVALQSANLDGRLFFVAAFADGRRIRVDADGGLAPMNADILALESSLIAAGSNNVPRLINSADNFYFSHHGQPVEFPVYRLLLNDSDATRYYFDAVSGEIVMKIDSAARGYRWMHEALHRLDFSEALRRRPTWDILMLILLSGTTLVCATGLYAAIRRVSGTSRE